MTKLEECAKAMFEVVQATHMPGYDDPEPATWGGITKDLRAMFVRMAEANIKALMAPSKEMMLSATNSDSFSDALHSALQSVLDGK